MATVKKKRNPGALPVDVREEIARAAYLAWERDGRTEGQDEQYWLEAETQVRSGRKAARGG